MENNQHNVTVYSTPTCPYCVVAKEFLNRKGIVFRDVDVSRDEKFAREMIEKSGQMGVPVIEIDQNIVVGFDENTLEELLK